MNRGDYFGTFFLSSSPFASLGESAKKYASELAEELGVSLEMVACALLLIFAAAQTGARCEVSRNYCEQLSLYIAVGAPPSAGKTPLIKRILSSLLSIIDKYILFSQDEINRINARIEMLEEDKKELKKKYRKEKYVIKQDEYVEMLSDINKQILSLEIPVSPIVGKMSIPSFSKELSVRKGRGIMIDAEGAILPELKTVSPSEHIPIIQAWSGEKITDITKKDNICIESPSFVMLAMWQTSPLIEVFQNAKYRENGFVARFLLYIEENWCPRGGQGCVSDECEGWYKRQLELAFCRAMQFGKCENPGPEFNLSEEAQVVLRNYKEFIFYVQSNSPQWRAFGDVVGKSITQAIRLSIVLFSMDNNSLSCRTIDGDSMLRACCLSLYFVDRLIDVINNTFFEKMLKASWELMCKIAIWQSKCSGIVDEGFDAEEPRRRLKLSKAKCDQILYWMQDNDWVYNRKLDKFDSFGNREIVEEWVPIKNFNELILSYEKMYNFF